MVPFYNYITRRIKKIQWEETSQHKVSIVGEMVQIDFKRIDKSQNQIQEFLLIKKWT